MLLGHNIERRHSQHDAYTVLRASKPVPVSVFEERAINVTAITLPATNESETSEIRLEGDNSRPMKESNPSGRANSQEQAQISPSYGNGSTCCWLKRGTEKKRL